MYTHTDYVFEIMWAKDEKYASDNGLKNPNQDIKRPVRFAVLADSIVIVSYGSMGLGHRRHGNYMCDKLRVVPYKLLWSPCNSGVKNGPMV